MEYRPTPLIVNLKNRQLLAQNLAEALPSDRQKTIKDTDLIFNCRCALKPQSRASADEEASNLPKRLQTLSLASRPKPPLPPAGSAILPSRASTKMATVLKKKADKKLLKPEKKQAKARKKVALDDLNQLLFKQQKCLKKAPQKEGKLKKIRREIKRAKVQLKIANFELSTIVDQRICF